MRVSVIIPNFNGEELIQKNLPFVLKAAENRNNKISEIILVDDASGDNSVTVVKQSFPSVRLIKHTKNRGVSATINTGVRSSTSELICLLNTDVIPNNDFLESTFLHFEDKNVFSVSLHEEGYGWARGFFKDGFIMHSPGGEDTSVHSTFWVSGGSAIFRKSIWKKLGGMDERIFSPFYWEDIDISYRAQKRGYRLLWDPNAHVLHEHEGTVKKLPKRLVNRIRERNQLLFIWKNITSPNLTRRHVVGLLKRLIGHPGYIVIVISALKKFGAVRRARKKEKKACRVSDEAVLAAFR